MFHQGNRAGLIICPDGSTLSAYCREHGLNYNAVYSRLRRGATIEQALDVPPIDQQDEQAVQLKQLCAERRISYDVVRTRIKNLGWDIERALNTDIHNGALPHHFVQYKGEEMGLNEALRTFLKDNSLTLTTGTAGVVNLAKKSNISLQQAFDAYCEKILKKYRRI